MTLDTSGKVCVPNKTHGKKVRQRHGKDESQKVTCKIRMERHAWRWCAEAKGQAAGEREGDTLTCMWHGTMATSKRQTFKKAFHSHIYVIPEILYQRKLFMAKQAKECGKK